MEVKIGDKVSKGSVLALIKDNDSGTSDEIEKSEKSKINKHPTPEEEILLEKEEIPSDEKDVLIEEEKILPETEKIIKEAESVVPKESNENLSKKIKFMQNQMEQILIQ